MNNADEKQVLNLGLNFHLQNKISPIKKKLKIELLYQRLLDMADNGKVSMNWRTVFVMKVTKLDQIIPLNY